MKLFVTNLCALMWKDETILVKSGPGAVRDTLGGCVSRLRWSISTPQTLPKIVNWILETILKVFLTKLCTLMWKVGSKLIKSVQRFAKDTPGGCVRRLKWTVSLHFVFHLSTQDVTKKCYAHFCSEWKWLRSSEACPADLLRSYDDPRSPRHRECKSMPAVYTWGQHSLDQGFTFSPEWSRFACIRESVCFSRIRPFKSLHMNPRECPKPPGGAGMMVSHSTTPETPFVTKSCADRATA